MAINTSRAALTALVARLKCKPGWSFRLETSSETGGLELIVRVPGYDSRAASCTDAVLQWSQIVSAAFKDHNQDVIRESCEQLSNAWDTHRRFTVDHHFPVPLATYGARAWRRWVFECCRGVENHELGEWFRDGSERPFSPLHGPGELPYVVHEFRPASDALTTQDGALREPYS